MATTYKITLAGSLDVVEGTEHLNTYELCEAWLAENQVYYSAEDPEKPATDSVKYILYTTEED
jgi:hypothetical protein